MSRQGLPTTAVYESNRAMPLLAPSILAADFGRLEAHAREAIDAGADWLHVDVMDGHFVPNISLGPPVLRSLRSLREETGTLLDVHLMIDEPERYIEAFAEAGADIITVHVETCPHLHRVIQQIREAGARVGVTLNPATPIGHLDEVLPLVDLVLVMSVNPGFGGQAFIPSSLGKIRRLRHELNALGSDAYLEVDGGVKPENALQIRQAGADVLVAGSAIFKGNGTVAENVAAFRQAMVLEV